MSVQFRSLSSPAEYLGPGSQVTVPLRHGTRFPSSQAMGPMRNLLPKIQQQVVGNHLAGRGHLCPEDLARLKAWRFRVSPQEDKRLTKSGEEEMLGLGRRWANRVPGLRAGNHSWIYTDTQVCRDSCMVTLQRTRESARRFKEGLGCSTSLPPPEPNRKLLAFYNICKEYKKTIFQVSYQ